MKKFSLFKRALLLSALILGSKAAQASMTLMVDTLGFKINPQLILSLYNVAQQTNGVINSYPAGMDAAVITVTVVNKDTMYAASPCFRIDVYEENNSTVIVTGGKLTLKTPLNPGETRQANASSFEVSGSFSGTIDQGLQDQFKNMQPNDQASLQKTVDFVMKKKFRVCLVPIDCGGGSPVGAASCDIFTLFTGNPMADCSVPMIIFPHNNGIYSAFPSFAWVPAQHRSCTPDRVSYLIEIMKGEEGGAPYARIKVPAGQNFYQWSASDPVIEAGVKYFWRIIGLDCGGQPFCGPSSRGWNIIKWFIWEDKTGCTYTLGDIDNYVRRNASPEIAEKLKKFLAARLSQPNGFNDPFVCRLLSGQARLNSIEFQTK